MTSLSIPSASALQGGIPTGNYIMGQAWTGQIIDGIHIGDPERTSGIRRYQILKIQRQSQMQKSMPMICHSLRFSNSTQDTRNQEDKTYRVRPAPPTDPWQSKQMKERKCTLHLTRLVPVVLSYQALIHYSANQPGVYETCRNIFDGFPWGNLLYGPIISTVNAINNITSTEE